MVLQEAVHVGRGVGNKVGDEEGNQVGLDVVKQGVLSVNRPKCLGLVEGNECIGRHNLIVGVVVERVQRAEFEGS